MKDEFVLAAVCQYMEYDYMPDRDSIALLRAFKNYYRENGKVPPYSALIEAVDGNSNATHLLKDIHGSTEGLGTDECMKLLEEYLKRVRFQKAYKESGAEYNNDGYDKAVKTMRDYLEWAQGFSLTESDYTDIIKSFKDRFKKNRQRHNEPENTNQVNRFYIDELDAANNGRNLRTQLTYILAATGIGKSHCIRYIGSRACLDGLNVLHFQLEGSKKEVEDAYSAALVGCNSYRYEYGTLRDSDLEHMVEMLKGVSGCLYVKSYPKFNTHVTTIKIKEGITEFKKRYKVTPDVVLIDSADLLSDSSGRKYGENGERHRRIAVANDLKDLAADENVWIVATYQSTIENREWLNDESNVLTEYNTAEAKGLSRPLTHLITLNQSDNEYREQTMRINVAKSRFFKKPKVFKIATDYENETFYDRQRTMNINKTNQ